MSVNPEPTDVGPAVGGDLAVTDVDKQQVVQLLQTAHDDGRLTPEELLTRQAQAQRAETFDDLIPLTRDLVPLDQPRTFTLSTSPDSAVPETGDGTSESIVAVFSGSSRKGNWLVPKSLNILAVFGGAELDLTSATFEDNVCEITVFCAFGGAEVTVPDHARVVNRAAGGLFGGMDITYPDDIDPQAPTIIIKGFAFFGGASVGPKKKAKKKGK